MNFVMQSFTPNKKLLSWVTKMQCLIWAGHGGVLGTFCCVLLTVNCSSVQAIKTVQKFGREKSECTFHPPTLPHWEDPSDYSGLHCIAVLDEDPGARHGKTLASSGDIRRIFPFPVILLFTAVLMPWFKPLIECLGALQHLLNKEGTITQFLFIHSHLGSYTRISWGIISF